MAGKSRNPRPKGLSVDGGRLWKATTEVYVLRVDELVLLESACRTADYVAKLDAELVGQPLVVKGSMGQEREHPLLSEVRQQRAALARLLSQLKLPEEGSFQATARSNQARTAARSRWG